MPLSNVNQELVNRAKANIQLNADELLGALGHVPDDKLNWAPSESTRSPLQIAAHCGVPALVPPTTYQPLPDVPVVLYIE